jgi:DNA-binding response OmpR family regulator
MRLANILVVDDSELLHRMYDLVLMRYRQKGARIFHAHNGAEALTIIGANEIDLVLLDINMPVLNGLQTLAALGESGTLERLRVIMVSTEGRDAEVRSALSLGAIGYVTKPFSPANLHTIIDRTFETADALAAAGA